MTRPAGLTRVDVAQVLVLWASEVVALLILSALVTGVRVDGVGAAMVAVTLIALLNAVVRPVLVRLTLPLTVFSLGLFSLVLNGLVILAVSTVDDGFRVTGLGPAIVVVAGLTLVTTVVSALASVDDEAVYERGVTRRLRRLGRGGADAATPGVVFLEVDGLSEPLLREAMREGHAPTMARWVEEGSHRIVAWECDLSSQTGASQAGLLHGSNHDMPAFRWWDRAEGRMIVSNHPRDAAEIERRVSDGDGLLADGGASRGNMLTGDAPHTIVTMSALKRLGRAQRQEFIAYFSDPYSFTRSLLLAAWDVVLEKHAAWRQRHDDVRPRLDRERRGLVYPGVRAVTTVILRDINIYTLIGDLFRGLPSAYATFVGYDEVAHHSGVRAPDAWSVLRKLDRQFARVQRAARHAARPYHFVVLSDHGQSPGTTFLQRYDETLEDVVRGLLGRPAVVEAHGSGDEGYGLVGAGLTEAIGDGDSAGSRVLRRVMRSRTYDGYVTVGPQGDEVSALDREAGTDPADLLVLASGCLGLIYLAREPERQLLEAIEAEHPQLVRGLTAHPGLGFVAVRSGERGTVVFGPAGWRALESGDGEGEDPLAPFGPYAAAHVLRNDRFPSAPDILVNSACDPVTGEVAAFEELVGSHGGLGGDQGHAFILYPSDWPVPDGPIVGAAAAHDVLKGWVRSVNHGAPPAPPRPSR